MIGIEEAYCNTAISALIGANANLLDSTIEEVLQNIQVWGKGDTLGLDAKPEITIAERLKKFDQYAILITEERGEDANPLAKSSPESDRGPRTFFVSDPTDRSSQLRQFLKTASECSRFVTVGQAIKADGAIEQWEKAYGAPIQITGAFSAITCVRRGLPICAVLLNYITQEVTVACSAGIYQAALPRPDALVDLNFMRTQGRPISFIEGQPKHAKKFVTFLGKTGYRENILSSRLVSEPEIETRLHYSLPGGPSRVLYLSDLQPANQPIGFIVANGEKIGEWIHWLAFARFAKTRDDWHELPLRIYEIFQDRPWTRDGILMSTSPVYSIFKVVDAIQGKMVIDVDRLKAIPNPSRYRSTLLVSPINNDWTMQLVQQYGHRPIEFYSV